MRLGLTVGYSGRGMGMPVDLILEAERLGFDSVWTAEAYGSDAITPLAWVGAQTTRIRLGTAIMQIPARTPAMCAMTAMTLDALSGGRFVLGLGPSGPQVVEGWHGVRYGKPLARTREYIQIIRSILKREKHVGNDLLVSRIVLSLSTRKKEIISVGKKQVQVLLRLEAKPLKTPKLLK